MTTNADRIIEALRQHPGLDDDALERVADVHPRQQVNQICRRLEKQGILKRFVGTNNKVENILISDHVSANFSTMSDKGAAPDSSRPSTRLTASPRSRSIAVPCKVESILFIICCSSAKRSCIGARVTGPSVLDTLTPSLAKQLATAREAIHVRAGVDETTLIPAWQRYCGTLYETAGHALSEIDKRGLDLMIVSGGYGLVLAKEPIGTYDERFRQSLWPRGLLEEVLIDYTRRRRLKSIRAITSTTGDYRKLLERVDWSAAGVDDAVLLHPRAGRGALKTSPRAQGEVLKDLVRGTIDADWSSSDGLQLDIVPLT